MTAAERLRSEGHKEGLLEGHKEGRQEGHKEGRQEGHREYLVTMLQARFGALPAAVRAAIDAAEKATLDRWFEQGITARTLEEIFPDAA